MKSQSSIYNEHIEDLVDGILWENQKSKNRYNFKRDNLIELIKKEYPYSDFLNGLKYKTIQVNSIVFSRKTKMSDSGNFQKPLVIKTLY